MNAAEIIQGSPEWFAARLGQVTASKISDVMAGGKGVTRNNYLAQLAAERLSGKVAEGFTSQAMQHGAETEDQARLSYEFLEGAVAKTVGFVPHPVITMSGASPDGTVGDLGLVEIKCPNTATHIATLQDGNIPRNYRLQMQWQMACTEREWCDFASFDPRMPPNMQLHVTRVKRDQTEIDEIEEAVRAFLTDLDSLVADLTSRYEIKEAA